MGGVPQPAKKPCAYSYVRMSTERQLLGDSLRRQRDMSRQYAASQGWELLEENQLQDVGISAFSGANASGGALSRFLKAIRERKVPTGSFLIVESFDRLTRQEALKSFGLFSEIINAGVNSSGMQPLLSKRRWRCARWSSMATN